MPLIGIIATEATVRSKAYEQAIHRRSEPEEGKPFREAVHGRRGAVDSNLPPLGRCYERAGADFRCPQARGDGPSAAAAQTRHF